MYFSLNLFVIYYNSEQKEFGARGDLRIIKYYVKDFLLYKVTVHGPDLYITLIQNIPF